MLRHVAFEPAKDQLVVGGDLIDRGKESGKVVKRIKLLQEQYPENIFAVIGNHEEMMMWFLESKSRMWLLHGGLDAIRSFKKTFATERELQEHIEWLSKLPLIVEDDEYVYTHAGLNPYRPLDQQSRDILWMDESEFYGFSREDLLKLTGGKPIIHGHTPVEYIWFDGARMNCDMGSHTYFDKKVRGLGLIDLNNKEYYVYRPYQRKISKHRIHFS